MPERIPVTVLTGFLGAGKTTLVNRILSEQHGRRIAVIENEFGEVGVDHALVIGADEEIFETSNGCICCTVRGDLIRILTQLLKRRDRFDCILIETTGLADPGPVAQTFFIDEDLKEHFLLDAIVTLVDARHLESALEDSETAAEQIAFADVVVLNKTDLVDAAALARVSRRIAAINGTARVLPAVNAGVSLDQVLGIGAFDLDRALSRDEAFLQPPQPFEWAGLYALPAGTQVLHTGAHAHEHAHEHEHEHEHEHDHDHDHEQGVHDDAGVEGAHEHAHGHGALATVDAVWLPAAGADAAALESLMPAAAQWFAADPLEYRGGDTLPPQQRNRLQLGGHADFLLEVPHGGHWALFMEHAPAEFGLRLPGTQALVEREFGSHHHDDAIASVGLMDSRPLNVDKVNDWLSYLLQSRGQDILRMKGVLNLRGEPRRYVFHGVHMMFDGQLERPWNGERISRLVFIGRNLDRAELEAGFESCVA